MQHPAAAGAGRALNVDHLLDPLEMGGKPTAVDVAALGLAIRRDRLELGRDAGQHCLGLLEREAELILEQLLRARAEAVSLERGDDAGQPLDLRVCFGTERSAAW